jgi:type III restriction enzyme
MSMKLQFKHDKPEQACAVRSTINLFKGHPKGQGSASAMVDCDDDLPLGSDLVFANRMLLDENCVLDNLKAVQKENKLPLSNSLDGMNFSIEMETGTGKTYVFLRTIHELYQEYGFSKFIIVVPSIAIREGVLKNLEITKDDFNLLFANPGIDFEVFDPKRKGQARSFARSQSPRIMVINIDSFSKASDELSEASRNIIYRNSDWGVPIEYIRTTRPIVIIDEPQNMESEKRRQALSNLNPLLSLRYSATHRNSYNLIYKLDPVQAYDLGLVKKIEVDSTVVEQGGNCAFMELMDIKASARAISVKLKIDVNTKDGVERKFVTAKRSMVYSSKSSGETNLYKLSNDRDAYKDGYIIDSVNVEKQTVTFSNGKTIRTGESSGGLTDVLMRQQIENTVSRHFEKEKMLRSRNIKVLSLFFIDRVSNYRDIAETGEPTKGKFALWFEESFKKYSAQPEYKDLIPFEATRVHDGYFSIDKKKIHSPFEEVSLKGNATEADSQTSSFNLIMRDKERLLSSEEPLRFIFSHSALKEGWDNPNVFQICTLTESNSEMSKRQKIGRGLRLPVDKDGNQVKDGNIAVLTVFASESFADFAKDLQRELSEDCGVEFGHRLKPSRDRRNLKPRKKLLDDEQFLELWKRISSATRYLVEFDTNKLIALSAKELRNVTISPLTIIRTIHGVSIDKKQGVGGSVKVSENKHVENIPSDWIPDVLGQLQSRTGLTRETLWKILKDSGKLGDIAINPDLFIEQANGIIENILLTLMVDGIKYEKINTIIPGWDMHSFASEELETYLDGLLKVKNTEKTAYIAKEDGNTYVQIDHDSNPEKKFASDLDSLENVKFYMKLPRNFTIPTPLGPYTPDWAVVLEKDRKLYFVAETKSYGQELRPSEEMKIKCGKQHFETIKSDESGPLYFGPVSEMADVIRQLPGNDSKITYI